MMAFLPFKRGSTPASVILNVMSVRTTWSIQALSEALTVKLCIGAPITKMSAAMSSVVSSSEWCRTPFMAGSSWSAGAKAAPTQASEMNAGGWWPMSWCVTFSPG